MTTNNGFDREVRFDIVEHIGILSTHSTGWNKELNLVSWNGGQPKYDIRDWDLGHEHMSRGVTLHEKEMRQMFDLMKKRRMGNRFKRDGYDRGEAQPVEPMDTQPDAPLDAQPAAPLDAQPAEEQQCENITSETSEDDFNEPQNAVI